MTQQIAMNLDTPKNDLCWVLYISTKIDNRGEMVPLCDNNGVIIFESHEAVMAEKHSHMLSVVDIIDVNDLSGTVHNFTHARNVTRQR